MDEVLVIAADLARQRADLEAEQRLREQRGEDLVDVLTKLQAMQPRGESTEAELDPPGEAAP